MFSLCWTRTHRFVFLVKPNHFGATEEYNLVLSISLQRRQSATCILHFYSSSTQWFLSSTSITLYMLLCFVTQGPNLFWLTIQKIPSWKLMSKGEREITSKLNHFKRGRVYFKQGEICNHIQRPVMLGVQEERSHMSLRGERHVMFLWSDMFLLWFCFPTFTHYPI